MGFVNCFGGVEGGGGGRVRGGGGVEGVVGSKHNDAFC